MTARKIAIVAVDDDPDMLQLVSAALGEDPDVELLTVADPIDGLELVRRVRPRIVLLDLMMPKMNGIELLERIVQLDPATDVILMTAVYTTETAVDAIRKGACDYINKPIERKALRKRIDPLIVEARRLQMARQLDEAMVRACRFEGIIGRNPLMHDVFGRILRAAPYARTALVTGPTGTGKELVARAIHHLSPAARGPFVVCNCAAIQESLFESELFGHVRGAFTGATSDKPGMFEVADGGTLFLDEIGEIPLSSQAKLLRALQSHEVKRVGATRTRKVNVQIVCATNRDLTKEVKAGRFREDLYFRISMLTISLPSLAERREDIPLLMAHFIGKFAGEYGKAVEGLTLRAETALLRHPWHGNVRELENVVGYACMMTGSTKIDLCDLPPGFSSGADETDRPEGAGAGPGALISLDEMARIHARRVMEAVGGDKVRAAEILGVSRATLYRLLNKPR